VVPIINLEWIQKLHRDQNVRGYSQDAVVETILRRMPDYVNSHLPAIQPHPCQFPARADRGHQQSLRRHGHPHRRRVHGGDPLRQSQGHRLSVPLSMLHNSWMSRPNNIVVPGGKMGLAMQFIFTPMILRLMDLKRRAQ
jgi:phosphoribulokinase